MIRTLFILLSIISVSFVSCSNNNDPITISNAWVREPPPGASITAAYMSIQTKADDKLIGIETNIADKAEIHSSTVNDQGMVKMQMLNSVDIPSGKPVEFKPGGTHIMLIELNRQLKNNDEVKIILEFEKLGLKEVTAQVRGLDYKKKKHDH